MGQLKRLILVFLLLVCIVSAHAQTGYFTVKDITKDSSFFSFPVFSRVADTIVTNNINQLLQLTELELLVGQQKNNIFEKIAGDTGKPGKDAIGYQIYANNSKILSIEFAEDACGASCGTWRACYNFNSSTGDLIQLKDLFTTDGYAILKKNILENRTQKFKEDLIKIDSAQREELYTVLDCYKDDDLRDYYIQGSSIFFQGFNCLDRNAIHFDISFIMQMSLSEYKKYLNDYGRIIFGVKKRDK